MAPEKSFSYTVGYALLPEKVSGVVQPSLVAAAAERGMRLVAVDVSRPLAEQGPFDLLVHKMYDRGWRAQLEDFTARHPSVPVVDSPAAIDRLLDRATMLDAVSGLPVPVSVPTQVVVTDAAALANNPDDGLRLPLIAKPLAVDGSAESHDMRLVYRRDGLRGLRAPVVLQEFVNHGGVLFKVYVVGDHATCVRRSSLPDVPSHRLLDTYGGEASVPFANISNQPLPDDNGDADADMPDAGFVDEVARGLRRGLGLHLLNFDMIRESREEHGDRYFVIDINYFPGYAKMPGYETALTDFFLEMLAASGRPVHGRGQLGGSGLDIEARKLEAGPGIGLTEVESGRAQA